MVPAGKRITFTVAGTVSAWFSNTVEDVRSNVIAGLDPYGTVASITITPNGTVITGTLDWSYRATVIYAAAVDHASVDDIKSIVAHAFYDAAGAMPTVSAPGDPDPGNTGNSNSNAGVPWSSVIVFASVAIGLLAILGLKKL